MVTWLTKLQRCLGNRVQPYRQRRGEGMWADSERSLPSHSILIGQGKERVVKQIHLSGLSFLLHKTKALSQMISQDFNILWIQEVMTCASAPKKTRLQAPATIHPWPEESSSAD